MARYTVLLLATLIAVPAFGQFRAHNDYVGGSFFRGRLDVQSDTVFGGLFSLPQTADYKLNTLDLRLGVEISQWAHIEGRVAYGLNDKANNGIEFSIHRMAGIYGVVGPFNNEVISPYALIGVTYGELDFRIPNLIGDRETETDLSYGIGANVQVTNSIDVFLEYMHFLDKNGVNFNGIGLGLKFGL